MLAVVEAEHGEHALQADAVPCAAIWLRNGARPMCRECIDANPPKNPRMTVPEV